MHYCLRALFCLCLFFCVSFSIFFPINQAYASHQVHCAKVDVCYFSHVSEILDLEVSYTPVFYTPIPNVLNSG